MSFEIFNTVFAEMCFNIIPANTWEATVLAGESTRPYKS